ncbi:MAG: class I SAM-dependent methyltransferase [Actinomycetota bacterium]|nr:class I SAM-dependent methyltransferase [Actinomycetota bacterium]
MPARRSAVSTERSSTLRHVVRRYWYRALERVSPAGYLAWNRRFPDRFVVDATTDLVIEGYPAAANSLARETLSITQPGISVASHLHSATQVRRALALGVPVLIVLRPPVDSIASVMARFPDHRFRPGSELRRYERFYSEIAPLADQVALSRFEDTVGRLGTVVRAMNNQFGSEFVEFVDDDPVLEKHVTSVLDGWSSTVFGNRAAAVTPRPSEARSDALEAARQRVRARRYGGRLARCEALHAQLDVLAGRRLQASEGDSGSGRTPGRDRPMPAVPPPEEIYAPSRDVRDLAQCNFYHVMDLPGYGTTTGEWDLRGHEADYLGRFNVKGKRVLEIGPASGCLTFFMEAQGADVVAFDLSPAEDQDLVPFAGSNWQAKAVARRPYRDGLNNSWWLGHRVFRSKAKMVHGTVYQLPHVLGEFHVATFCSVLLHFRDPLLALQRVLRLTTETVIISDVMPEHPWHLDRLLRRLRRRHVVFLPDAATGQPDDAFWLLNPDVIRRMLAVLGFGRSTVTYHQAWSVGQSRNVPYFTVVGHRTRAGE